MQRRACTALAKLLPRTVNEKIILYKIIIDSIIDLKNFNGNTKSSPRVLEHGMLKHGMLKHVC